MDSSKKRKLKEPEEEVEDEELEEDEEEEEEEEEGEEDEGKEEEQENGSEAADEVRALLEPFSKEQILDLFTPSALKNPKLLSKIRKLADKDPAHRKLFVRGLGWDFTVETLRGVFSPYGEIEDCSVIRDKQTGKSKGYGFVTFKHMDAARKALKEPTKKIEGRVTVAQLASVGPTAPSTDQVGRKIYVGNVPHDLSPNKLLSFFSQYGDIEEGPIGFDKVIGKFKGYALFIYKSAVSVKKALKDPVKIIDGHQVNCKMATSDGGQKPRADVSADLGHGHSGGIVGAAPNLPYTALSGLVPLNQGILGQHSLLAAQGLLSGLTPSTGLASLNPSLAHQLALGSSLNTSLNSSVNSISSSLNASLPQGGSQGLSQASLASYGLHGLGMYGSQVAGLGGSTGGSSLYGGLAGAVGSQAGILSGASQGYTSSQLGQGSGGGRSQSLSGYFGGT